MLLNLATTNPYGVVLSLDAQWKPATEDTYPRLTSSVLKCMLELSDYRRGYLWFPPNQYDDVPRPVPILMSSEQPGASHAVIITVHDVVATTRDNISYEFSLSIYTCAPLP